MAVSVLTMSGITTTGTSAQFAVCNHNTAWPFGNEHIGQHNRMQRSYRSAFPWDAAATNAFDSGWQQWWYVDSSNLANWLDVGAAPVNCNWDEDDGISCVQRRYIMGGGQGREASHFAFASANIDDTDIEVNPAYGLESVGSCALGWNTQEGTFVHELGHSYGHAEFNDWLSTMNQWTPDITTCYPAGTLRRVRPGAQAQYCQHSIYGLAPNLDEGATLSHPLI